MTQKLIQSHTLSQCRLELLEGIEVISRYRLFNQIISSELGPEEASILAEPMKNIEQDRVNWYTGLSGEAVHYSNLSEEEKTRLTAMVAQRAGQFVDLAARLKTSRASNRVIAGEFLERIFSREELLDLYLVDGKPVVVGWGLSSGPGRLEHVPKGVPPSPAAPPESGAAETGAEAAPLSPPPADGAPKRRGCLGFMFPDFRAGCLPRLSLGCLPSLGLGCLGLLFRFALALAAGALLTWLLLHFFQPGLLASLLKKPTFDLPSFDLNQERETQLREQLNQVKRDYADRRAACRPEPPPAPEPESIPPAPEPELYKPAPEPDAPEPAPELPPDRDLSIPEDAAERNDFSFLEGCWASDSSELHNSRTLQPVIYIYCFDKNGKASVRLDEKDAQGRHLETCRTTATARFEGGGKLILRQNGGIRCPKGPPYRAYTAYCAPGPGGAAKCELRLTDTNQLMAPNASFHRVEE